MNLEVYNKKNPEDNIRVIYDTDMSEEDTESIDAVEKIFVNLNRQMLKDGIGLWVSMSLHWALPIIVHTIFCANISLVLLIIV